MSFIKFKNLLVASFITLCGISCVKAELVDTFSYSEYKKSDPKSIVVLMPSSKAKDKTAAPAVLSSVLAPLSELGYYVLPVTLVNDAFKEMGLKDAESIYNLPYQKIREITGADAALALEVINYGYVGLARAEVRVYAKLIDLRTGKYLWDYTTYMTDAAQFTSYTFFLQLAAASLAQAIIDGSYVAYNLAPVENEFMFSPSRKRPMLYGPYSSHYRQDEVLKDR